MKRKKGDFERRQTGIPHAEPVGLSDEFATDAVKLTQWAAFLRRARLRKEAPPLDELVVAVRAFLTPMIRATADPSASEMVWPPGGPWERR